ncbi:hypothetical protein Tco_1563433 [Tanacetum coccineum]
MAMMKDVHDLRSVETEFPAIVFNDELSSEKTLSREPTVSSLNNNEIDFRISFDKSEDEDYMIWLFHLEIRGICILELFELRVERFREGVLDLDTVGDLEYLRLFALGRKKGAMISGGQFVAHFAVLEDMDAYRDVGIGDVIFGEPFLREVRINAKRFEGMITIYNGNEEVTYQMTSLKKIDDVGEVCTIWKSGSVRVLKL